MHVSVVRLEFRRLSPGDAEVLQAASEHEAKKMDFERAREAVQERIDNGHDHGRPPIGFRFDEAGERWVPGREGRFEDVVEAIRMVENGATYRDVQEELKIAPTTMSGVMKRCERYLQEVKTI